MYRKITFLVLIILSTTSFSQLSSSDEILTTIVEYETKDVHGKFYGANATGADNNFTPVAMYKGYTFFVYLDSLRRPIIGKVKSGVDRGEAEINILDDVTVGLNQDGDEYIVEDDGHQKFSMGIDNQGYIHIIGDIKHYGTSQYDFVERYRPKKDTAGFRDIILSYQGNRDILDNYILYWVSEKPGDISSFEFRGNNDELSIPGYGFGYPSFHVDMNGILYFRHRMKVGGSGHYTGEIGYGVSKYDTGTKKWTALGKIPPSENFGENYNEFVKPLYKAVIWTNKGVGSPRNWYQGFSSAMNIDMNNRIHCSAPISNNNDLNFAETIIYACSDDGGESFKKVDGTAITQLPVGVDEGPNQGSVVTSSSDAGYHISHSLSFDKDGSPILTYTQAKVNGSIVNGLELGVYKFWNTETNDWTSEINNPVGELIRHLNVLDMNGVINFIGPQNDGKIIRNFGLSTNINPNTFYNLNGTFAGIDQRGIREGNELRGVMYDDSSQSFKIVSAKWTPNLTDFSNEWQLAAQGSAVNESSGMFRDIFQLKSKGGIFNNEISGIKVMQATTGNFEFQARIINVDYSADSAFAGLLIEDNENNLFYSTAITAYEGIKTASTNNELITFNGYEPSEWLKIVRVGNILKSYRSDNGKIWEFLDEKEVDMSNDVKIGLISGSGNINNSGHARVDNVEFKSIDNTVYDEYMVTHYKFNNDVLDSSTNRLHGLNNNVTFPSLSSKSTALFSGNNDSFVSIANNDKLKLQKLTVSLWLKPMDLNNDTGIIKATASDGWSNGWRIINNGGNLVARMSTNESAKSLSISNLKLNEWNKVTMTYDGNIFSLYLNDYESKSIELSGNIEYSSSIPMTIGKSNGVQNFIGELDEIKLYSTALDSKNINENYRNEFQYYQNDLIAEYKFDNNTLDSSLNELDGIKNNVIFKNSSEYNVTAYFNSNNSFVTVESNDKLKLKSFTCSLIFKPYSLDGVKGLLRSVDSDGFTGGWRLIANGTSAIFRVTTDQGSETVTSTGIKLNEWNKITISYSNENIQILLNGNELKEKTHAGNLIYPNTRAMLIGDSNGSNNFFGEMENLKIYNGDKLFEIHNELNALNLTSNAKRLPDQPANLSVSVYPNPASNQLILHINSSIIDRYLEIYNNAGKLILHKRINTENTILDISSLKSNIYFLKITEKNNKAMIVKKIVVK